MTTQRQLDDAKMPLDHPYSGRPHRVYVALTNHCNRSCPWCSTCSSPSRNTFLSPDRLLEAIPPKGDFEIQLEGGEPTTHPQFDHFVRTACSLPGMRRLILCTNGLLPSARPARTPSLAGPPGPTMHAQAVIQPLSLLSRSELIGTGCGGKGRFREPRRRSSSGAQCPPAPKSCRGGNMAQEGRSAGCTGELCEHFLPATVRLRGRSTGLGAPSLGRP